MSREYLDGFMTPEVPLAHSLTVYRHTFEIKEDNIANAGADNGFEQTMRFVVALLSEVEVVPESDVVQTGAGNLDCSNLQAR